MLKMASGIRNHPIISFIVSVMLWSWGLWSLLFTVIEPGGMLHDPPPAALLFAMLGGIGPSLGGLVLTKIVHGKEGMRALGARLTNWRAGYWWLAIPIIPAITFLTPLIRFGMGYPVDFAAMKSLILPGLAIGAVAGLMEEIGWRGFLLPQLLKRFSPAVATLILGAIWGGLWHGYADYFGLGDRGVYFVPLMLLLGPGLLTAWSLLMTWVYEKTSGSLLLSILMHASISSSAFIFGQQYRSAAEEVGWAAVSVTLALLTSGLIFGLARPGGSVPVIVK
jgi:uncharacterized protein